MQDNPPYCLVLFTTSKFPKTPVTNRAKNFFKKRRKKKEIKRESILLSPTVTHAIPSLTRAQSFPLLEKKKRKQSATKWFR